MTSKIMNKRIYVSPDVEIICLDEAYTLLSGTPIAVESLNESIPSGNGNEDYGSFDAKKYNAFEYDNLGK